MTINKANLKCDTSFQKNQFIQIVKTVPDMNRAVSATKLEIARRESADVIAVLADQCAKIWVNQFKVCKKIIKCAK